MVQAVGQEHHIPPCAIGVAVPCAVAGVVAQGLAVIGVKLEIFLALLIAQLTLCHGEQVFVPHAGQGGAGLIQPIGFIVYAVQRVGQAVHIMMMLFHAADGVGGVVRRIACVGVMVHRAFGHRGDHHRLCSADRGFEHGHGVVVRVQLLDQFAFFVAAHQLLFGLGLHGIAAFVVGMFKFITDQAAVLRVEAIVGVDVLLLRTGEHRHFGGHFRVAVIGVLMRHPDVLRFRRLCGDIGACIHAEALVEDDALIRLAGRPVLRLAFFVAADQNLRVALRRVGVLFLVAKVVGGLRNAVAVQLPVDEQSRHHGKRQHQRGVTPQLQTVAPELLLILSHNVFHCPQNLPNFNGSMRNWTRAILAKRPCPRSGFFQRSRSHCCGCRWMWRGGRPERSTGFPAPDRET